MSFSRAACRFVLAWLLLGLSLSGCSAQPAPAIATAAPLRAATAEMGLREKAAAEATAMIAKAEATALMLQAQAKATALIEQAAPANATPQPQQSEKAADASADVGEIIQTQPAGDLAALQDEDAYTVELMNVGYAGEGGFIIVNFRASKKAVDDFWPGRMALTDEATGTVYNEVATMPLIGPLIGRPREPGQPGYVMFVNFPPGLPPGSLVTIQLGKFKQEHVQVDE